MIDYLILAEKPSAAKKFQKALGGTKGTFSGHSFQIVASHGHLMAFKEPTAMLKDQSLVTKYQSWDIKDLPWNPRDFTWQRTYIKSLNPRTKKMSSSVETIQQIKKASSNIDILVIATDDDPSGEGQLIGWEIINAIGWKGKVGRMYFEDESVKSIQKAYQNIVELPTQFQDGEYLKAEARSRWDYLSMQLTRASTDVARKANYSVKSVRQGRLKSVIIRHIYEQEQARKNYVRKPYYEVKFKDEKGNVFTNKTDSAFRSEQKLECEQAANKLTPSPVTGIEKTVKMTAPGALLDLAGLAAKLAPQGFGAKEVLNTYQKLYEAEYVSYPRTEDKKITIEQFNDLLPLVKRIAAVVNVDSNLLTHTKPRKKHITQDAAHGANRPGLKVPNSLTDLAQYGKSAPAIYEILARNYLAILGEDYVYEQIKAHLEKYPVYQTTINVPKELNYKKIFNDDPDEKKESSQGIGETAKPFVFEGANQKPTKPTMKWITKYLEKYNVGTGATRTSTLAELVNGTNAPLKESKGAYTMTQIGNITAILNDQTWIASVKITERLFKAMEQVGKFKLTPAQVIETADQTVKHDLPIIQKNAQSLASQAGKPQGTLVKKAKVTCTFNGQEISFSKTWGSHTFSEQEIADLLAGKTITFETIKKYKKKTYKNQVTGSLQLQSYKGHKYWGFKMDEPKRK
ncbi:DNA topoisomerase [Bombilactobacillus bombi]|uniref:DNA topoisomerase n=1 Tax=Bombilactobacillus bombi TaxID=1303590 RepID=UPI0035E77D56